MAFRKRMSGRSYGKRFRKGKRVHKKNYQRTMKRGGIRL